MDAADVSKKDREPKERVGRRHGPQRSESGCSVFRLSGCELLAAAGASRNRARASANECGAEKVGCEEQ